MKELVTAVQSYALAHYADGKGWDYIIETYTDAELEELLREGGATTVSAAIQVAGETVGIWGERDAEAAAFRRNEAAGW